MLYNLHHLVFRLNTVSEIEQSLIYLLCPEYNRVEIFLALRERRLAVSPSMHSVAVLSTWLRERHAAIKSREKDALSCLYADKDAISHRQLMMERAELIATLDVETKGMVAALPESIRDETAEKLQRFANGARNALRLDSIFYMSALLYPDEHKAGEPDNMELLLRGLDL